MKHAILLVFLNLPILLSAELPPDVPKTSSGMEVGQWSVEPWSNAGSVDRVAVNGQKLLQVLYTGGEKDKAAFKHITHFGIAPKGTLTLNVFTFLDKPPTVAVGVCTTAAYKWHESQPQNLKTGWNALTFKIGENEWKTEASGWKYSVAVAPPDDIRAVDVIVYNGAQTGVLFLQGLNYDPDETGQKVATFVKDLQSEDAETRERAEKAMVAIGAPALEMLHQIADDERPEVLLRAASAIRQIEAIPEEKPKDPTILEAIEKQKEAQGFDDIRRRCEYTLRGIDTERQRLLGLLKDAKDVVADGRKGQPDLKFTEEEKRKDLTATLDKLEQTIKELEAMPKPPEAEKKEAMKK